jgi:YD repeat-containing protein
LLGGAFSAGSPLYSFVIPDQGGYEKNGNLLTAVDSVMGQWNYSYDNLNRLVGATAPTAQPSGVSAYFASVQTGWSYDTFGNRTAETQNTISGETPTASMPTSSSATYTAASNQIATTTLASGITYDASTEVSLLRRVRKQGAVLRTSVTQVQARRSGSNRSAIR